MRGNRNKENRENRKNSGTFARKWLIIGPAVVAALAISAIAIVYAPLDSHVNSPAQAQEPSLGQLMRSISPITVQPIIVNEKLTSVGARQS